MVYTSVVDCAPCSVYDAAVGSPLHLQPVAVDVVGALRRVGGRDEFDARRVVRQDVDEAVLALVGGQAGGDHRLLAAHRVQVLYSVHHTHCSEHERQYTAMFSSKVVTKFKYAVQVN